MRIRRLAATGAVLALSLGVVACNGGDEEPTAAPSTTTEKTTDAASTEPDETSEAAPDVPKPDPADYPGKDEQTEEGAKQAVRYYWAMLFWGYQTGDTSELESLFDRDCSNCKENFEAIVSESERGYFWQGGEVESEEFEVTNHEVHEYAVQYHFIYSEHKENNLDSGELEVEAAEKYKTAVGVNWNDGAWVVSGVSFEVEDA